MSDLSQRQAMQGRNNSEIYVIYDKPVDYPSSFVVQRFHLQEPVGDPILVPTLEEARRKVPRNRINMGRAMDDAPSVVEVWL